MIHRFKRGDVRDDGKIFFRYCQGYEMWKTKDAFDLAVQKHRNINIKSYHKNREARYKNHIEYIKSIEGTDKGVQRKIASSVRSRLNKFISKKGKLKLIGCAIDEYKVYLESKMTYGMTWDNYGSSWHIDHIIPLSRFNLNIDEELKSAAHYLNTRPMWAKENLSKGNKLSKYEAQISIPI